MQNFKSLAAGAALAFASFAGLAGEVTHFQDPPSVRTRAEVVAELLQARANGELSPTVGQAEATPFREAVAAAARYRDARDVRVVRSGAAGARQ